MALTAGAIYVGAVAATAGILAATREEALLDGPAYIRDAEPEGITRRIGLALARQTCRAYADGNTDVSPARAAQFENACRPYLDSVGYGTGPTLLKPFEGGQCNAVYTVNVTLNVDSPGPTTFPLQARGPIGGIREVPSGTGTFIVQLFCRGVVLSGSTNCRSVADTGAGWYLLGGTGTNGGGGPRINSVTPCGLDNCGNPPPVFTDPEPPDTPGPTFQPVVIIPIVDIDAGVEINVDGTVDVTIDGVEITIDPFGDGDGDGDGGGVGPDDLVPDGGLAGSPADTGNGGLAAGEAPPGQELVGVRVEVLESPVGANQYANNAAVVYRGIGYVRMGYSGRLALDVGASAVISPQFFLAPVRGLTNWEHRANNGFINRVTPFYRELPS